MDELSNKDLFKAIKRESKDHSEDIKDITEGFPYFCLKIFWDNLSEDEIVDALVGLKTNDEGIDAFFIDEENKEMHFIQCKSCESENQIKALKKDWLSFFNDAPQKLENVKYIDEHKNPRLKEIAKDYILKKNKGFKSKLHFFHLGREGNSNVLSNYPDIIYYNLEKIKEEYLEFDSKRDKTEPPEIEIQLSYDVIQPAIIDEHKTLISIITGDELINLRESYRFKLFDKNLRFSLGPNKINTNIIKTSRENPENFYFYNNGITITSKGFKYQPTNGRLKIEFPQIINGAQTVNAIYEAYKKEEDEQSRRNGNDSRDEVKEEFKKIKLLFRIIQDESKDRQKTSDFEKDVIRYNNTQNTIKETDFYSNNREQIKLQEIFAKFGYFYEIKRGDRKYLDDNPKYEHNLLKKKKGDFLYWKENINIEELASLWMAYKKNPTKEKVKKGKIFGHDSYDTIFDKEEKLTDETVKEMILAYNLFKIISEQTKIFISGQIIPKISECDENNDSYPNLKEGLFENIQKIIQNSLIYNDTIKEKFDNKETFLENKEDLQPRIKGDYVFSISKYFTLNIFELILDKNHYIEKLISTDLFKNKNFIKENIVKKWIRTILDDLIKPEYDDFLKKIGGSTNNFYGRSKTIENINDKFDSLDMKKGEEFEDLFPIKFGNKNSHNKDTGKENNINVTKKNNNLPEYDRYVLGILYKEKSGSLSTKKLRKKIDQEGLVSENDKEINPNKKEPFYFQKVRNVKSNKNNTTNSITLGYLEDIKDGLKITEKGINYVKENLIDLI